MSPPPISTLIPSTTILTAVFPPKSPQSSSLSDPKQSQSSSSLSLVPTTRRKAAAGVILTSIVSLIHFLHQPPVATAFSLGICTWTTIHARFSITPSFFRINLSTHWCDMLNYLSRTKGLAERTKEEGIQVSISSDWCLSQQSPGCIPHNQYCSEIG